MIDKLLGDRMARLLVALLLNCLAGISYISQRKR